MAVSTVVCGRRGRMSSLLAEAVAAAEGLTLAGRLDLRADAVASDGTVGALHDLPAPAPVVVDFTVPEATARLLAQAASTACALVIGTSGLSAAQHAGMRELSRHRAVLYAANFSAALAASRRLVGELARWASPDWAAGVIDVHFAGKRDAPSATALALADAWRVHREPEQNPAIASFRIGDAVSEHRFLASGGGEQIEICHRINDRAAFVPGVLAAIRFVDSAAPGLYALEDAL